MRNPEGKTPLWDLDADSDSLKINLGESASGCELGTSASAQVTVASCCEKRYTNMWTTWATISLFLRALFHGITLLFQVSFSTHAISNHLTDFCLLLYFRNSATVCKLTCLLAHLMLFPVRAHLFLRSHKETTCTVWGHFTPTFSSERRAQCHTSTNLKIFAISANLRFL
jgi:hypothetical protein